MAIGPVTATNPEFNPVKLQSYGLGTSGTPTESGLTVDGQGASAASYTPDTEVAQALASAYATLAGANSRLLSASTTPISSTDSASSISGLNAALGMSAAMALNAYANQEGGLTSGRTAHELASEAQASSASTPENAVQSAIQAAQATTLSSTLSLLA